MPHFAECPDCAGRGWLPDCTIRKALGICLNSFATVTFSVGRVKIMTDNKIFEGLADTPEEALLRALDAATKEEA